MHRDPQAASAADNLIPAQPNDKAIDSMADRGRRSWLARGMSGLVAMTLWLSPLQVSM